jgi:hypothetical protein
MILSRRSAIGNSPYFCPAGPAESAPLGAAPMILVFATIKSLAEERVDL